MPASAVAAAAALAAAIRTGFAPAAAWTIVDDVNPTVSRKILGTTHCAVVPRKKTVTRIARSRTQDVLELDVAVRRTIDETTTAATLIPEVEALRDFLGNDEPPSLDGMPAARIVDAQIDPLYSPEHLEQHRLFFAVVRVTIKL